MADKQIRIRVGASRDASLTDVFRPLLDAAKRARALSSAEGKAAGREIGAGFKDGVGKAEKAFAELAAEVRGEGRSMLSPGTRAVVEFGKEAKRSFNATRAEFDRMARDLERGTDRIGRLRPAGGGPGPRASVVAGGLRTATSLATRTAAGMLSGAGVELGLAPHVAKNTEFEKRAVDLANAGYQQGAPGAAGVRQDPAAIMRELRSTANDTGLDINAAAEGLGKFVGKTGDLETGRRVMKDLAVLSRATGTNLEDMVDAAGDVSANLGEIPNKATAIDHIMKTVAAQGKLGAVEMRDLASQMAKIAANAGQFEGDIAQNITMLGAFAQEARQRGGASSATQAATSVAALTNTFKTPARVAAFKKAGINVTNASGMIRNPEELVIEALQKTGRDPVAFKKLFANVQGARAVEGLATTYRQAYAGASGNDQERMAEATRAVREELGKFKSVVMSDEEVMTAFRASMNTAEAQTTVLNNRLSEAAAQLQAGLTPALTALVPVVTSQLIPALTTVGNAVANLFGGSHNTDLKKSGEIENASVRATTRMRREMGSGTVSTENSEIFDKATADLMADVEKREKELAAMRAPDKPLSGWDVATGGIQRRAIAKGWGAITGDTEAKENKIAESQSQLNASKIELADAQGLARHIASALQSGELKVRVIGQPAAPVVAPSDGRTSPPGATGVPRR